MLKITSKLANKQEYSCVQCELPEYVASKVIAWGKKHINENKLYTEPNEFGRELDIHVTAKYGLHTENIKDIKSITDKFKPFTISLNKISKFKSENYDVIKIDVNSKTLSDLNSKLSELPNSDSHPVYSAHCTIAYVKKNSCNHLLDNTDLKQDDIQVKSLVFSSSSGNQKILLA